MKPSNAFTFFLVVFLYIHLLISVKDFDFTVCIIDIEVLITTWFLWFFFQFTYTLYFLYFCVKGFLKLRRMFDVPRFVKNDLLKF